MNIIHANVYDPAHSLFKSCRNDRAQVQTITCSAPSCSLRDQGKCVKRSILFVGCPYGEYLKEEGPTRKSKAYGKWVKEKKEQYATAGTMDYAPSKLAFMGDYVYLPYSWMDMNESVKFLKHSSFLISGVPFIHVSEWSVETIEKIVDFKPWGLGGTIHAYQDEQIPLFLVHLSEMVPELYAALIKRCPQYVERYKLGVPNYVGRAAFIWTMPPCEIAGYNPKYPVRWTWDCEKLTTNSIDAYNNTWGNIKAESLSLTIVPDINVTVKITNNSQVSKDTKFAD